MRLYDILHGHGVTGAVRGGLISAIDCALWDIKGKALGVPVWELLGGKMREAIPVYGHASTPEAAEKLVDRGYRFFKWELYTKWPEGLARRKGKKQEVS